MAAAGGPPGPALTVDVVIELEHEIVLIERANPPLGLALPGGFVDRGERVEQAARREAREETGLEVELLALLGVYSDPNRDPRLHTASVVYVARADGRPAAGDDAAVVLLADPERPPGSLVFDHQRIVEDYLTWRAAGRPGWPVKPLP